MTAEDLFSVDELAQARAAVEDIQREADEFSEWLRSPEGAAWVDAQVRDISAIAEKFERECVEGKYRLTAAEMNQLRRDGIFVSHRG